MSIPLIAVIYDGISNSVFESQVVQPLINEKQKKPERPIWLISFESDITIPLSAQLITHEIQCIRYKKISFIGQWSLRIVAFQLKKFLLRFVRYELLARGPLAGFICLQVLDTNKCTQITIQARGLLAEEYAYTHRSDTHIRRLLRLLRKKQFSMLEKYVYGYAPRTTQSLTIQAVSPALADYLIATYGTPVDRISIALDDIPPMIPVDQRTHWRITMRKQMNIDLQAQVYCYNGSMKPWQFPDGILQLFKDTYVEDATRVLLILTQDKAFFEQLIKKYALPSHAYRIYTVPHTRIYEYLSACDVGILLREQNIINWTSRPTKLLEYQAVGLKIVHNNSVAYAMEKVKQTEK